MTTPEQRVHDERLYGDIPRSAIRLRGGHLFDIFDRSTWKWDLDEVAHALSNLCRFNGQVDFYSVAEHCLRVSEWIEVQYPENALAALLGLHHEDEESIVGDVVSPHKRALYFVPTGDELRATLPFDGLSARLRHNAWASLLEVPTFGISVETMEIVKEADGAVYGLEAAERPRVGESLTPKTARLLWLERHDLLVARLKEKQA